MTETLYDYVPPVAELLTMGDVRKISGWPDYLALGLTPAHVPDLIRMSLDDDLHWADGDSDEVWAPVHAWRALGQLRVETAIEPLISLLDRIDEFDDDWASIELPKVFAHIGEPTLEPLTRCLADPERGLWARVAAASSFVEISKHHPDLRERCVAALTQQLEQFEKLDPRLNGFIISYLIDLQAVESAPVIEQAFAADQVEISIPGDWEDVQIGLGLLQKRLSPRPDYHLFDSSLASLLGEGQKPGQPRQKKRRQPGDSAAKARAKIRTKLKAKSKSRAKAKARRKQQKKARKKSRKRK